MAVKCRSWMRRNWRWLGLSVLLLSLCAIPEAAARAGGGGSFSSGGGGGGFSGGGGGGFSSSRSSGSGFQGSSRSGGGGDGSVLAFLVPLGVVLLVMFLSSQQASAQLQGRGIRRGRRLASQRSREKGIEQIRATDPGFSQDGFYHRTGQGFLHLQEAWSNQDLAPVRHFISDAVHERFSLQLAEMRRRGVRNIMENVFVEENTIAQVDVDAQFQTITIRIRASAVDYEVDTAGKRVSGTGAPDSFAEYWSFVRRPGAQTTEGDGLLEGNCPNCGAALQLNQAAECESCGAKVRSGQYDWVLAEITQESEWQANQHREVPGFATMAAADPAFSLQHLEDRASVMFWRRIAAFQSGKTDPLRKMAREEYCAALESELRPDSEGMRIVPTEAAVGSVETAAIVCAEPVDKALLDVHWSCGQERRMPDGSRRPRATVSFRSCFFLLSRNHGVTGNADEALSSSHCPGCGSPTMAGVANACEYCGAVLNQGDQDWVLDGVYPANDPVVIDLLDRDRPTPAAGQDSGGAAPSGGTALVAWVIHVMLADGEIDAKEERLLRDFASGHGIPEATLQALVVAMKAGALEVESPGDENEARRWLEAMAEMALADGFVAKEEQATMHALAQHLNLSRYDVNQIVIRTRSRLYKEEKQRMRELRRQA